MENANEDGAGDLDDQEPKELPGGWIELMSPQGIPYYYHEQTNTSTWIRPGSEEELEQQAEQPGEQHEEGEALKEESKEVGLSASHSETQARPQERAENEDPAGQQSALEKERASERAKIEAEQRERELQHRKDLKRKLAERDSIMDPKTLETIREWLKLVEEIPKDDVEEKRKMLLEGIDLLSSGYVGYGDMIRKAVDWLDIVGGDTEKDLGSKVATEHLKEVIKAKFQPEKVAGAMEMDKPPSWLLEMLGSPVWRNLLIVLGGKHKNVPLLDFSVRAITEAGHYAEVSEVTAVSTFFSVFRRTLTDCLERIVKTPLEDQPALYEAEKKLYTLCSQTEYTYIFAIDVLQTMEGGAASDIVSNAIDDSLDMPTVARCKFRRLRQGLTSWNNNSDKNNTNAPSSAMMMEGFPELLRLALERRRFSPDTLSQLRDLYDPESNFYKGVEEESHPMPPVWPLRQVDVLVLLSRQLFGSPFFTTDLPSLRNGSYILACASALPSPMKGSGKTTRDMARQYSEQVRQVHQDIMEALQICNDENTITLAGLHRQSTGIQTLMRLVRAHPCISAGVLLWTRALFLAARFQRSSAFTTGVVTLLFLVRTSVKSHPLQQNQAFFVLTQAFGIAPENIFPTKLLEIKKHVIDEMVVIMETGHVLPVIEFFRNQAVSKTIDLTLLRHFVVRLLNAATPPYSKDFRDATVELLNTPSCSRAIYQAHNSSLNKMVSNFKTTCETLKRVEENTALKIKVKGAFSESSREEMSDVKNGPTNNASTQSNSPSKKGIETIKLVPFSASSMKAQKQ